jgi:hypothetical protein
VTSEGVVIDVLFASSGIEQEILATADVIGVLPGLSVPVARTDHLIVLKALAADETRPQDEADIRFSRSRRRTTARMPGPWRG